MPATEPIEAENLLSASGVATLRRNLLRWYDANHRTLPWRDHPAPYTTWISEIMLQQTQVATVLPYFERFIAAFPTVRALADAPQEQVLQYWAGLGYYTRARNLHRAAQVIRDDCNGRFPTTYDGLRGLPGIGDYTAGAIASICFDQRVPAVDGNVLRVVARLTNCALPINANNGKSAIRTATMRLLPRQRVGDFNQALMELGARVCKPNSAATCSTCPVRNQCVASANDRVAQLPVKLKKAKPRAQDWVVIALQCSDLYYFRQRPPTGLWGGLWELPTVDADGGPIDRVARDHLSELFCKAPQDRKPMLNAFGSVTHQLTHRLITFHGFRARLTGAKPPAELSHQKSRWVKPAEARKMGISTAMQKVLDRLVAADRA